MHVQSWLYWLQRSFNSSRAGKTMRRSFHPSLIEHKKS